MVNLCYDVLNGLNLTKFEFENAIKRMNTKIEKYITTGIIFWKIYSCSYRSILIFIKASTYVDKLYVLICFEKQRDEELLKKFYFT